MPLLFEEYLSFCRRLSLIHIISEGWDLIMDQLKRDGNPFSERGSEGYTLFVHEEMYGFEEELGNNFNIMFMK